MYAMPDVKILGFGDFSPILPQHTMCHQNRITFHRDIAFNDFQDGDRPPC